MTKAVLSKAKWLLKEEGRLRDKVARGGIWLTLGMFLTRIASFIKIAILARILSPSDFGLMGIALMIMKWVEYFTEAGLTPGLIQMKDDVRSYLNTAWTSHVLRSLGIAVIVTVAAPFGAQFFGNMRATPIVRCLAAVTILWGFTNPAVVYFRRNLDFRKEVLWRCSNDVAGLLVAIPLALIFRNVWALVGSVIAAQFAGTIASYVLSDYRPRFEWRRQKARELFEFGRWMFVMNIVAFFEQNLDSVAIGHWLGAASLGVYQLANQLSLMATTQLLGNIEAVMFPALSRIDDNRALGKAFERSAVVLLSVIAPAACFLSLNAGIVVRIALGPRWAAVVPAVTILAWSSIAIAMLVLTRALAMAVGKPNLSVYGTSAKVLFMAAFIVPALRWTGVNGVALIITIGTFIGAILQTFLIMRIIPVQISGMLKGIFPGLIASAVVVSCSMFSKFTPGYWMFGAQIVVLGSYLLWCFKEIRAEFRTPVLQPAAEVAQ